MSETDVLWRENMQLLQCYTVGTAAVSTAAACANYTLRGEQYTTISTNLRKQLYYIYNNIIKTTKSYMFQTLLVHHQGVQ
jgi:cobalamin biosynthesis protein CbiD